jgi:predicted small lipoprotein YifL
VSGRARPWPLALALLALLALAGLGACGKEGDLRLPTPEEQRGAEAE